MKIGSAVFGSIAATLALSVAPNHVVAIDIMPNLSNHRENIGLGIKTPMPTIAEDSITPNLSKRLNDQKPLLIADALADAQNAIRKAVSDTERTIESLINNRDIAADEVNSIKNNISKVREQMKSNPSLKSTLAELESKRISAIQNLAKQRENLINAQENLGRLRRAASKAGAIESIAVSRFLGIIRTGGTVLSAIAIFEELDRNISPGKGGWYDHRTCDGVSTLVPWGDSIGSNTTKERYDICMKIRQMSPEQYNYWLEACIEKDIPHYKCPTDTKKSGRPTQPFQNNNNNAIAAPRTIYRANQGQMSDEEYRWQAKCRFNGTRLDVCPNSPQTSSTPSSQPRQPRPQIQPPQPRQQQNQEKKEEPLACKGDFWQLTFSCK